MSGHSSTKSAVQSIAPGVIALAIVFAVAWNVAPRGLAAWAYALASVVTFVVYGADKRAARIGSRRTSEAALHALSLFGGWPGALAGQGAFRHKTRKQSFRMIFWVTVLANIAMLLGFAAVVRG